VRTRSRVEEWRDEVAEISATEEKEEEVVAGRIEDGQSEEEKSDEEEASLEEYEDDLPSPGEATRAISAPRRVAPPPPAPSSHLSSSHSASASSSVPVSQTSSLEPSRAGGKRKKPSCSRPVVSTHKKTQKTAKQSVADNDSSPRDGSGSASREGSSRVYKTKDFLKLLPKRRKVVRVRQDSDEEEGGSESDAETDYEYVPSLFLPPFLVNRLICSPRSQALLLPSPPPFKLQTRPVEQEENGRFFHIAAQSDVREGGEEEGGCEGQGEGC
jgi:hypothetical protein